MIDELYRSTLSEPVAGWKVVKKRQMEVSPLGTLGKLFLVYLLGLA